MLIYRVILPIISGLALDGAWLNGVKATIDTSEGKKLNNIASYYTGISD